METLTPKDKDSDENPKSKRRCKSGEVGGFTKETEPEPEPCDETGLELRQEEKEESATIRFSPPAYIQRYNRVGDELQKRLSVSDDLPKSILEVGCAELSMHVYLKRLSKVQKVMYLDKDSELLFRAKHKIRPLPYEKLIPREEPLTVEVFSGCITKTDIRVSNSNPPLYAIVGIEILEHLDEDVEIEFIYTLFEKYSPPVVILTTPNGDFNSVLGLKAGEFRHWDHRFEMTRLEFFDWCTLVCQYCPWYTFTINGICEGPAGTEQYGCLSQMAIFELIDDYVPSLSTSYSRAPTFVLRNADSSYSSITKCKETKSTTTTATQEISIDELVDLESKPVIILNSDNYEPYNMIERVQYPWRPKRPLRELVVDEVRYYINNILLRHEKLQEFWESMETTTSVSLKTLVSICKSLPNATDLNEKQLRSWLKEEQFQLTGGSTSNSSVIIKIPTYAEYDDNTNASGSNSETEDVKYNCDTNPHDGDDEDWE